MIVTFDSGILVRATRASSGPARALVELISESSRHKMVLSPFIIGEVGKVLAYPRLMERLKLTPDGIHDHLAYLRRISSSIEPARGIPVVLTDPNDDPIVYTAVAAGADVLCALDRDLHSPNVVRFCQSHGIAVMTDLELLTHLRLLR